MSLWKIFEGVRYCGGVCEHSLRRYKRIRDNRDKLVELGFMRLDDPLECYRTKEWEEHTAAYSECTFHFIYNCNLVFMDYNVDEICIFFSRDIPLNRDSSNKNHNFLL